MPLLIGLTGPAGCGKDTIAERLLTMHGFTPTAFATPLRAAAAEAFGIDYWDFLEREKKDVVHEFWGITPRQMLQRMGTDAMRGTFGDEFWTRRWMLTYREGVRTDNVVVTDVRFENEAKLLRNLGGVIVHVSRPNLPNLEGDHVSGQGIAFKDGDLRLANDHDMKGLFEKVDALMELVHVGGAQ